jgi:cytochrome P450
MLYLGKYPEVQEKARLELDRVCGTDRMPIWKDFKDLPYINCIVKEGLRIRPLIAAGVPHRARQDDWFDEMLIPKDATIFINAYAIHQGMDKDPELFDPDRYLDRPKLAMDYAGSPDYQNRDHYRYVMRACGLFGSAKAHYSTMRVISCTHMFVVIDRLRTTGRLALTF